MNLPNHKREFLIKYADRLSERGFIIDTMTMVGNRPMLVVYDDELPKKADDEIVISLISNSKEYVPPAMDNIPEEIMKNPVHNFRFTEKCEMVFRGDDIYSLIYTWRNWLAMPEDLKEKSDAKAKELFGKSNEQLFTMFWIEYFNKTKSGDIFTVVSLKGDDTCLAYIDRYSKDEFVFKYLDSGETRIFNEIDTFTINPGDIVNCKEPCETTVGRFLLNEVLFVQPFDDFFPYCNDLWNVDKTHKAIAKAMLAGTIKVPQYKKYVDRLFFIGHFTELCVPGYSRAALTTHPDMQKVKEELLAKYKGRLNDPLVIAEIENILIALDKEYLKNDIVMRFYAPLGAKPFNIARKKMYIAVGGIEAFSKDSGQYTFIANSLSEGWDVKSFPAIANEIRKGSYNRGHETQNGGAQTNDLVRVFQDLKIVMDDCGTDKGLIVDFKKISVDNFLGRTIRVGNEWITITDSNKNNFVNKSYLMRSPMYCTAKSGLCYKCAGETYSKLDIKHVSMLAVDISSTFTKLSLKAMHGTKLSIFEVTDLENFVIS